MFLTDDMRAELTREDLTRLLIAAEDVLAVYDRMRACEGVPGEEVETTYESLRSAVGAAR